MYNDMIKSWARTHRHPEATGYNIIKWFLFGNGLKCDTCDKEFSSEQCVKAYCKDCYKEGSKPMDGFMGCEY